MIVVLVLAWGGEWTWDWLLYSGAVALSAFLMVFEYYVFAEWMRRALYSPPGISCLAAARVALAASLVFPPTLYFPHVLFGPDFQLDRLMLLAALFGMTMVAFLAVLARCIDAQLRGHQEWSNLDIDSGKGAPS